MKSQSLGHSILCIILCMTGGLAATSCSLFDTKETVSFDSRPYKVIALSTEPGYIEAASAKALRNKGYKVLREWNDMDKPNAYLSLEKEASHSCKDPGGRTRYYSRVIGQLRSSNGTLIWKGKGACLAEDFESYCTKASTRSAAIKVISFLPDYGDHPGMPPKKDR